MARGAAGAGPACEGGGRLTPRVSELKTASQIAAEELADPGIRREHERTALAHAVAIPMIGYRSITAYRGAGLPACSACTSPRSRARRLMTTSRRSLPWPAGESAWSITSTSPLTSSSCAALPDSGSDRTRPACRRSTAFSCRAAAAQHSSPGHHGAAGRPGRVSGTSARFAHGRELDDRLGPQRPAAAAWTGSSRSAS